MKIRKTKFNFDNTPNHYLRGNLFSTHFVNSLHIIFPVGEHFFIKSVKPFMANIKEEQLKKDVSNFIGQEATHAFQHEKFWKILQNQGFDIEKYSKFMDYLSNNIIVKNYTKLLGKEKAQKFSLAITAALEHYTAMLAEVVFEHEENWEQLPDDIRNLIKWHAAEEIEHKSVAFDLLNSVDKSFALRSFSMLMATNLLFGYSLMGISYFIINDSKINHKKIPLDFIDFVKTIASPSFKKFASQWVLFFKRDFHPSQIDNMHFAENYFKENPQYYK
ncbi:MAG: metal-dependent hydrolase [Bacteroidetes bacterium]|nr:metal-dependent hydrolase [Bacteroidota bacterium]